LPYAVKYSTPYGENFVKKEVNVYFVYTASRDIVKIHKYSGCLKVKSFLVLALVFYVTPM